MISRRLKWAVSAQLVATAALVSPAMAHPDPGDCTTPPAQFLRACDETCEINDIGSEYDVHVDGYTCTLAGEVDWDASGKEFPGEADTEQEANVEVCPELQEQCEEWRDGGGGAT